ncbi:EF-P 5-aminopentanol modification-associated protein YfmF [Virgibacillus proomii]|uniref:EF-P 5-aminopentanol modification-associated protein YfmF n=1 Tax=Virgibacillus proomii TaxID=84407 RepID=UPI001C1047B5|nr:pitrilysin family protein [Virgibacillus proomii]MBU5267735.1 insulinase family protein [Virgibacillus proomii]
MEKITETIKQTNGYYFHYIPTKKYKTVTVVVKLKAPLEKKTITKRALLPYVLRQGTKRYPTKQEFQLKLDELYGASISLDGAKKGENHIISLRLEIANQKFLQDNPPILIQGLNLLHDVLFDPNSDDNQFAPSVFNREKETLKQKILALKDDKMSYANMRLIDEMCKGEAYQLHVHGYMDELETITSKSLYAYYQQMIREDRMDVYIQGDLPLNRMEEIVTSIFELTPSASRNQNHQEASRSIVEKSPKQVIETDQIQQAKLHIGYRTNVTFDQPEYYALHVFNGIFGGFPSSKLFKNVREKNSLAYYAASRLESHKGLLLVFSGIAPKDFEKARDIIKNQMTAMKQGDFTSHQIEEAKAQITNQLLETLDHPQGTIEFLYQQILADKRINPIDFIERIKQVTKEEVVAVSKKLQEDTTYLLTSEKGDSHE